MKTEYLFWTVFDTHTLTNYHASLICKEVIFMSQVLSMHMLQLHVEPTG